MSAYGPKRTCLFAPHMSAFGGKADMTGCGCLLSRSLLGVKQTWLIAAHMSAFDPKRTLSTRARTRVIVVPHRMLMRCLRPPSPMAYFLYPRKITLQTATLATDGRERLGLRFNEGRTFDMSESSLPTRRSVLATSAAAGTAAMTVAAAQ